MLKRIPLGSTMNLRDLGGYPTVGGGETAWRRNYRSACPWELSDADLDRARGELGITTIIDLRTQSEMERQPCAFAGVDGFDYHPIPLFNDYGMDVFGPTSYFMIASHQPTMSQLFRTIASAEGGVLFHCTAGKDRTGVTAAILLMLAGVEDMDIVADYQVSRAYIDPLIQMLKREYPDMPQHAGESPAAFIEGFLARFRERWPSAEDYLRCIGLTDSEIARLTARMVG